MKIDYFKVLIRKRTNKLCIQVVLIIQSTISYN